MSSVHSLIQSHLKTSQNPLIVILGPTASGKTALAIELAHHFDGGIVSADSRQVYIGMDIGTAKVKNTKGITHHLIDLVSPDAPFSVAQYKELADVAIAEIRSQDQVPFLVGGTMLYIDAVTQNLQFPPVAPDQDVRADLEKKTPAELIALLTELDPECAGEIDAKNPRRLVRALEYCILTGEKFSEAREQGPKKYDTLLIGIDVPREELYKRIDARVDEQIRDGLVEETKQLAAKYSWDLPAMSSIGYRQIGMYLRGECTLDEAVQRLKFDTHAYARRQLTWWRSNKEIHWVVLEELS